MSVHAPDALTVSGGEEHCLAPVGLGCLRPDGARPAPHPSRVALARLVVDRRPLWVLDEPFVALDVAAVNWLAEELSNGPR